jgi:hypothetical protein
MNQHETGHAAASAGGLLFAAILGCLTVLSARPAENIHDNIAEIKPDTVASVERPTEA